MLSQQTVHKWKYLKKTLAGGFCCAITRLSFDTEIRVQNLTERDNSFISVDQSFKVYKRGDLKVICSIKPDSERKPEKTSLITKILKLDENNQYGFAMTKPMPKGCVKEHPSLSWLKFSMLFETVSLEDVIGHLFVVDIEFDKKKQHKNIFCTMKSLLP